MVNIDYYFNSTVGWDETQWNPSFTPNAGIALRSIPAYSSVWIPAFAEMTKAVIIFIAACYSEI